MPRLEMFERDLPHHNDPNQQKIAATILAHIHTGTPLKFRYHGGSEPGQTRIVLPTWLFCFDYFSFFELRVEDPTEIPEAMDMPIYVDAWCLARNAPRTFGLDQIQLLPADSLIP